MSHQIISSPLDPLSSLAASCLTFGVKEVTRHSVVCAPRSSFHHQPFVGVRGGVQQEGCAPAPQPEVRRRRASVRPASERSHIEGPLIASHSQLCQDPEKQERNFADQQREARYV